MKRTKVLRTMLAMMLPVGAALAGCSKQAAPSPSASTAQEQVKPADLKPVELSIYYPGGTEQKDQALVEAELNKLLKDKINATVKIYPIDWGSWPQKMNLMVAGGEPFDLVYTAGSDNFSGKVAQGYFAELNDLVEKYGQELKKSIDPLLLNGTKINGKLYAIPVQKEVAATQGVVINKKIADKYNMDLTKVKSLADLEPLLQTIKQNEPNVVPFWGTSNIQALLPFENVGSKQIPGVIMTDGQTKVINQFESPEMKALFTTMRDWNKKGYFQKDPTTQKEASAYVKAGTLFAQYQSLKPGKDKELSVGRDYQFVQLEFTKPYVASNGLTGAMTSISRTSKNPERAMMLINLLHTDKQIINTLVMGLEGKHYTKVSDTVIKKVDGSTGYSPGINWKFGNQFLNYLYDNEDPKKWEQFKQFNATATVSKLLGFTYNAEPVKNEESAIVNIYDSYIDGLATGVLDPEKDLAAFADKLKKAGADKVITEKQKQVDAFVKSK